MQPSLTRMSVIVFLSGFCSLVYQVTWLRLLRLIFGTSTLSTAVVLAIFMGGLGFGGLIFGRRVERATNPLRFYATIELGIALAAAASPLLVWLARQLYLGLGGASQLGLPGATGLRLILSIVVLGLPATLMGGTLPAVAQVMEKSADRGRRTVARLYGVNTLGAVAGAFLTTFVLIELLGVRQSLWLAAAINLLLALAVRRMSQSRAEKEVEAIAAETTKVDPATSANKVVLFAAFTVGFIFFLMEIVWYRMLGPILGGTLFTFGLILSIALAGIGLGGWFYSQGDRHKRPSLESLALTCALETLLLIIPFALGDRLAHFAAVLRPLQAQGFTALTLGWALIVGIVVLPTALVAGYQFPQLVALLGSGRDRVGSEVGLAYAWNTLGAICGSLIGGFYLLPWLSAPWLWRASAVTLALLTIVLLAAAAREDSASFRRRAGWPVVCVASSLLLCLAAGPSAFWRHSAIGAGRAKSVLDATPNQLREIIWDDRAAVLAEAEGVESSVALLARDDLALIVNGKSDGAVANDAPTTIMLGMVGAFLHPAPRRVLVIGLGSGMTAGWLAQVPEIESIDVVELEPAIAELSRECDSMTFSVTQSPKVNMIFGDGREVVRTGSEQYDLIVSEPSNPYRSGVADLFSQDYYRSVTRRLAPGGLYLHWLQGYEIDPEVVGTVYATLLSVFPHVESWQIHLLDLLLVASREAPVHDTNLIRQRATREPYHGALHRSWRISGVEGFYTGFLGHTDLARHAARGYEPSTDDRPIIEFGFARNLGRGGLFKIQDLHQLAQIAGASQPIEPLGSPIKWPRVQELRQVRHADRTFAATQQQAVTSIDARWRLEARTAYQAGDLARTGAAWASQPQPAETYFDRLLVAESAAIDPQADASAFLADVETFAPTEAMLLRAGWHWTRQEAEEAARHMELALGALRGDPWTYPPIALRSLNLAVEIARQDPIAAGKFFELLAQPFDVHRFETARRIKLLSLAAKADFAKYCGRAFAAYGSHVLWTEPFLSARWACYDQIGHPLTASALSQLEEFQAMSPRPLFDSNWDLANPDLANQDAVPTE